MQRFSKKSRKSQLGRAWPAYLLLGALWLAISAAHKNKMPQNLDDICTIFEERRDWYAAAKKSEERWGTPAHIQMAIIQQESSFRFNARPPRTKIMGFIPWTRQSNAYGYAQALDGTWVRYKNDTGRWYADRDHFDDAIDFIGWYTNLSNKSNKRRGIGPISLGNVPAGTSRKPFYAQRIDALTELAESTCPPTKHRLTADCYQIILHASPHFLRDTPTVGASPEARPAIPNAPTTHRLKGSIKRVWFIN